MRRRQRCWALYPPNASAISSLAFIMDFSDRYARGGSSVISTALTLHTEPDSSEGRVTTIETGRFPSIRRRREDSCCPSCWQTELKLARQRQQQFFNIRRMGWCSSASRSVVAAYGERRRTLLPGCGPPALPQGKTAPGRSGAVGAPNQLFVPHRSISIALAAVAPQQVTVMR